MRSKSIVLLVLALGCGLVASIGISQVMEARNKAPEQGEKQPVFVAMVDISPNEQLTAQNIKLEEWPKNLVPTGALTKLEEVEGKRSKMKIYAGETILGNRLVGANEALGAANQIPPGYRVIHVNVDSNSGSSNLILPGDRVDVLVFRNTSNDQSMAAAKIVLQDVRVFAVDTHTESDTRTKGEHGEPITARTIALLVTPPQALLLHTSSHISGSVRLVLRNPDDDAQVNTSAVTVGDIFGPEVRGDRNAEKVGERTRSDVTDWLDKEKETAPVETADIRIPQKKMILILGSEVTTVSFPANGDPPQTPKVGGSTNSTTTTGSEDNVFTPIDNPYTHDEQLKRSPISE